MKKSIVFSCIFLAVFLFLIFQSSFCWASEGVQEFDISLSDFGVDELLHVDFTGTNYTLEDYPYIYIMKRDNVFEVDFCKLPLYYSSSYDYNNNTYYTFASSTLNTDIIYNLYRLNNDVYEMYSNFINNTNVTYSTGYGGLVSNEYIYTDSSLSTHYTGLIYFVSDFIIGSNVTMMSVVSDISLNLGLDTLFLQIYNSIPVIVVAVLFVIGFIVFRRLIKGISKGKTQF